MEKDVSIDFQQVNYEVLTWFIWLRIGTMLGSCM